jgi:hypothetical protein
MLWYKRYDPADVTHAAACCLLSMQRVQSYRRLFAAAMAAALSLQPTDIHITSFSCAEYTLFNSSSTADRFEQKLDQSLTDVLEASTRPAGDEAGQSNRMTGDDAAAAAAATETTYADVSTIFTVTMPEIAQRQSQIASTILLQSSNVLASPLSKFFAVPVRAVYAATAEVQTAGDGNVTAATAGMELPSGIPAMSGSAAAATAAGLSTGQGATHANMRIAAASNTSISAGAATSLSAPQPSRKQQPQQQQQQQQVLLQQQTKQLPFKPQEQHQQQQTKYAAAVPVSTPGAAKTTNSGAAAADVDTRNAAPAAVTSMKTAKVKAVPSIYTPMKL